jgi:competence protein ComEA
MQRFFALLVAAIASLGLSTAVMAQKAETPKKAEATKTEAKKAEAPKADAKTELMDINSASEKDLATLPGIGDVRAKAIVKHRPYKGKNELADKKIIPQKVYDEIKDKIIAKQK